MVPIPGPAAAAETRSMLAQGLGKRRRSGTATLAPSPVAVAHLLPRALPTASAARCTAPPDPLFLDGCRVALHWPRENIGKPPIERVATVHYLPEETQRRRHARNHYLLVFAQRPKGRQPPRERWTRWKRLRGRRLSVLDSPRKAGKWSEEEGKAVVQRSRAGETDMSIGVSLGRSAASVQNRRHQLTNPDYAPLGHDQAGVPHDKSVKWSEACGRAISLLPQQRGTVHDVIGKLKELQYKLDGSPAPGRRHSRGYHNIAAALSRGPQFLKTGATVGRARVYEYRPQLAMLRPPARPRKPPNAKARSAGYDNVPMKTG